MRTAIDTNAISALWSGEPLASAISNLLDEAASAGGLVICGAVYAELRAHPRASREFVDKFLASTSITIDYSMDAATWEQAASRFARYVVRRRASHSRTPHAKRLLADFIIGAHALTRADRLLTLDTSRYARDFADLVQVDAGKAARI